MEVYEELLTDDQQSVYPGDVFCLAVHLAPRSATVASLLGGWTSHTQLRCFAVFVDLALSGNAVPKNKNFSVKMCET